jgi:uncharacterized membrane protein
MKPIALFVPLLWAGLGGAQTLKTFNMDDFSTGAWGINDAGEVVGSVYVYPEGATGFWRTPDGVIHRFSQWNFTANAVNNSGEIVGGFQGKDSFLMIPPAKPDIFLNHVSGQSNAMAINDAGYIVGFDNKHIGGVFKGSCFIRTPQKTYAGVMPRGTSAFCGAINNLNQIVGEVILNGGVEEAFMYDLHADSTTILSVPGANFTYPEGINDSGEVVGGWYDTGGDNHGFTWTSAGGYTSFDVPGAVNTSPNAINASGTIVGTFNEGWSLTGCSENYQQSCAQGFLLVDGVFTIIDAPGQLQTTLSAINNSGVIAGTGWNPNNTHKGDGGWFQTGLIYTPAAK